MGYNIEISFDLLKHNIETKNEITDLALQYNCDHYSYLYDTEGKCKIPRNHCIIVVNFKDEKQYIYDCANFLKIIKKNKDLHIECIYDDKIECTLLYASKYYLRTIDKDKVVKYNKNKNDKCYSDNELIILDPIFKI
jgi:hypothetical protein